METENPDCSEFEYKDVKETKKRISRISMKPNIVDHVIKSQKLTKLQEKKEAKKAEKLKEIRKKKEEKAANESPVTSPPIRKSPKNQGGLLKRRQLFRDEFLDLHCEWQDCSAVEARMEDFMRHVSKHVVEAEVKHNPPPLNDSFVCLWKECGFETINSAEMVRHINFHSFHTKVKCHGRNMLTSNNVLPCKLDSGQRNMLPDLSQPFQCEWEGCHLPEERWTHPQDFYWHVKDHAEDQEGKEVKCLWENCGRTDNAVSKLKEHLRRHSQERLVGCPTCGGLFANRVKFLDHCLKQQEGHSFVCPTCDKKFAIERHLKDHMRSHVNHYKCPHCDMTCPTPSTLSSHIKYRHTTEKPFSCEFCHYRGKTMADIKSHLRVHYNEVKVTCPEEGCDFTCRAKITLKQHLQAAHSDNLPKYVCHVCDEKYFKGSDLTKHLVKAHAYSTPSGHSRFRYTKDKTTGLFKLQTTRIESFDVLENLPVVDMKTKVVASRSRRGRRKGVSSKIPSVLPIIQSTASLGAGTLANEIIPEEEVKIEVNDAHETDVHINIENDMVSAAMMAAMSNVEPSDISMSMPIIGDMLDNEAEELVTLTEENVKPASVVVEDLPLEEVTITSDILEKITAQQDIIDSIAVDEDLITRMTHLDEDLNINDIQQSVVQNVTNNGDTESIVPDVTHIDFIDVPHQQVPDDMIVIPVLDSDIKEADIAVTCEEIEDASVEADYDKVVDVDLEEDSKTLKDKVEPVKGVNSEDPLKIES